MNADIGKNARLSYEMQAPSAADEALIQKFWDMCLSAAPLAALFFFRFCRSVAVFLASWGLMSVQPYHPNGHFIVGIAVALLSFANLTKWLALATIAFLLVIAIVPKPVFAAIGTAIFG